jgi:hypothetical protein
MHLFQPVTQPVNATVDYVTRKSEILSWFIEDAPTTQSCYETGCWEPTDFVDLGRAITIFSP